MNQKQTEIWHTIIIGAGASGLFCAGSFSASKLVLEHNECAGKKLSVTGGGKCNFTNLFLSAADYLSSQKHFCKNALAAFKPEHFTDILAQEKIPFYEKEKGQLFTYNAKEIVKLLEKRAKKQNSTFCYNTQVLSIQKEKDFFRVQTSKGVFYAYHVVVATGGVSYPALGASGFAFQVAQSLGINLISIRPALVGFRLPEPWKTICRSLAGNSLICTIKTQNREEEGQLLFTHDGISGPVVLQSSLFHQEGEKIFINFLPQKDALGFLKNHKNKKETFSKILSPFIAPKISKLILQELDRPACEATKEILQRAAARLNRFECIPVSTAGYTKAEVTAGGIDTKAIDCHCMQSKEIKGLFFIGEALDVTGRLGGFNLHWAWASAYICAQHLKKE